MQKINAIHSALLVLSLSGAAINAATPESLAATIHFCQERFNTTDKDTCQKLIENKEKENLKEILFYLPPFTEPMDAHIARMEELNQEGKILGKHLTALRNDVLTPDQIMQLYTQSFTETLRRCNTKSEAINFGNCAINGLLDEMKTIFNMPDIIKIGQTPGALESMDVLAAAGEQALKSEITRLKNDPELQHPVPVIMLEDLLEQVKTARAKLATAITPVLFHNIVVITEIHD